MFLCYSHNKCLHNLQKDKQRGNSFNSFTARVLDGVLYLVTLTFESMDQIPWCDHSDQSSLPVLTHGAMVKFGNLVEIYFWLNLVVKGLRTPLCKLIIWFEEDLPGPLLIWQRCMKNYHWPLQLNGTFFEPDELKEVYLFPCTWRGLPLNGNVHHTDQFRFAGKLPTYPSPKPSFCPKWEVSVNVSLGEG